MKARCATCGAEFANIHVCPVSTTTSSSIGFSTTYTNTTGGHYSGKVGMTFRCPHMQIYNVERVVCAVCGELKPTEE
jgi:hypothetical protein